MNFLKYFKQIFETITNRKNNWSIKYNNDDVEYNLDKRLHDRTDMSESYFDLFLTKIINNCESDNLFGTWVFVSFKFNAKIITRIEDKVLYIVTILGKNHKIKDTKNIKIII